MKFDLVNHYDCMVMSLCDPNNKTSLTVMQMTIYSYWIRFSSIEIGYIYYTDLVHIADFQHHFHHCRL